MDLARVIIFATTASAKVEEKGCATLLSKPIVISALPST